MFMHLVKRYEIKNSKPVRYFIKRVMNNLTKYEPSLVKESSSDKKYYCIDNGLHSVLLNPQSEDNGKLLENIVYLHLRRNLSAERGLHYYKNKKECDFVVTSYGEVVRLIQVTYSLHDEDTRIREAGGILEAAQATGCRDLLILTLEEEEEIEKDNYTIRVLPAWKWILTAIT